MYAVKFDVDKSNGALRDQIYGTLEDHQVMAFCITFQNIDLLN